jgi:hypothetical protein
MSIESQKISDLVFKANLKQDMGEFSLDMQMLKVLSDLDGIKSVAAVAQSLQMDLMEVKSILSRLYKLNLILQVPKIAGTTLKKDFFDALASGLGAAIGPMAKVVLRDTVKSMGEDPARFPRGRAAELVDRIAEKIVFPEKKSAFLAGIRSKLGTPR